MRRSRRDLIRLGAAAAGAALGARLLRPGAATARRQEPWGFLATHRIVSYYGTPLAPGLGALGQGTPAQVLGWLRAQADEYAALAPGREVVPALHLIYAVAQAAPTADGDYLNHAPDALVDELSALARENGMLLFLDNQLGTSTVARELGYMARWLAEPHVHLALDPEFVWGHPGLVPGGGANGDIGYLTALQIAQAQETLAGIAADNGLPDKVLVVHQFRHGMLPDRAAVRAVTGVELVLDMDGFGPPASKLETYAAVAPRDGVWQPGVKLFYEYDRPLMSAADVLALDPQPGVVIYQ